MTFKPLFPYTGYKKGGAKDELTSVLLKELNNLNNKLRLDNVSSCVITGIDNTIINTEIILSELHERQLSEKEKKRLTKLEGNHQLLLMGFEDWCSCSKSKDTLELIEFTKSITKKS